jgi:hypothetical protein
MQTNEQVIVAPKRKRATIAKRPDDERDLSDSTCTPKWLADYLAETHGPFSLDPCSNPRSWITSDWSYSLEKGLDGFKLPWRGSVFKNNPFSKPLPWQLKAHSEMTIGRCTELVELCKLDPSTEWWGVITAGVKPIGKYCAECAGSGRWQWTGTQGNCGTQTNCMICSGTGACVYYPDMWIFNDRIQYDENPELIEKRRQAYADAKARGEKPKGSKTGKSSNNFCSAIIHHRFDLPPLKLEPYATLWQRSN